MEWIHGSLKTMMMKRLWQTKRKRSTTDGWILSWQRNRQKATQIINNCNSNNNSNSNQWPVTLLQLAAILYRILPVRAFSKEANIGEEPSITTTTVVTTTALQRRRRLQPVLVLHPLEEEEKRALCHVTVKNRQLSVSSISTMLTVVVEETRKTSEPKRLQPEAWPAAAADNLLLLKEVDQEEEEEEALLVIITIRPSSSCSHELENFFKNCLKLKFSGWPQPLEPIMLRRSLPPGRVASRLFLATIPLPPPPTPQTHPTSSNWTNSIISFSSFRYKPSPYKVEAGNISIFYLCFLFWGGGGK